MQKNMSECFKIFLNISYMLDKQFLDVEHLEGKEYILEIKNKMQTANKFCEPQLFSMSFKNLRLFVDNLESEDSWILSLISNFYFPFFDILG